MVDENSMATLIMPGKTQYIKSNFENVDGVGLFSINQIPK
jgi:hypothetical protein